MFELTSTRAPKRGSIDCPGFYNSCANAADCVVADGDIFDDDDGDFDCRLRCQWSSRLSDTWDIRPRTRSSTRDRIWNRLVRKTNGYRTCYPPRPLPATKRLFFLFVYYILYSRVSHVMCNNKSTKAQPWVNAASAAAADVEWFEKISIDSVCVCVCVSLKWTLFYIINSLCLCVHWISIYVVVVVVVVLYIFLMKIK